MPTYAYACTECGHRFEIVQSFSDDSLTACPECRGRLRKVFDAVGVVFKGSGFYRTDSRSAARESASQGAGGSKGPGSDAAAAGSSAASSGSKDSSGSSGTSTSSGSGASGGSGSRQSSPSPSATRAAS